MEFFSKETLETARNLRLIDDALKNGKAVTCAQMCCKTEDSYQSLNDGAKVYYANTVCHDNTDKSELLNLF